MTNTVLWNRATVCVPSHLIWAWSTFGFISAGREEWQHSRRHHGRHQNYSSVRVWLLPVQSRWHSGRSGLFEPSEETFYLHSGINWWAKQATHYPTPILLPGNQQALSLPRALGWQPLLFRWTASPHLPAVPHVRALHAVCFHPSTSLLCPFGGFPRPLPLGGQRARQVNASITGDGFEIFLSIKHDLNLPAPLLLPFQCRGQPHIRAEQRTWPPGLGQGRSDPPGHSTHHVLRLRAHNPRCGWVRPHW